MRCALRSVACAVQTMAAEARRSFVKALRQVAKACGVPAAELPKDTAARDKVEALARQVEESSADAALKQRAAAAFEGYEATWPAEEDDGDGDPGDEVVKGFRMRGTSFLLTYNWDFFGTNFPDGTAAATSPEDLWRLWRTFKKQKKKDVQVQHSTSTLEASLHSDLSGRVHFHWKVDVAEALDEPNTTCFAFHGVMPDARRPYAAPGSKAARGANFQEASNRGHFYCWAPKKGTLYTGTNYKPWERYRVLGKWLDDLWTDEKLENDAYEALALRVRVGFAERKRNLETVRAAEKEMWIDRRVSRVDDALDEIRAPFRTFDAVKQWEDSFLDLDFRWKLLALVADSASGKSNYAESLFSKPLVLTVEEAEHLDLRNFECDQHDGLVLDNCNSWAQLLRWRAVLQARNCKSRGGQSATNVHAYPQYLYGVAVVATVDWDAPDSYLVNKDSPWRSRWLCKNTVVVRLPEGEAFYDKTKVPAKRVHNAFSKFAQTVKRRRMAEGQLTGEQRESPDL